MKSYIYICTALWKGIFLKRLRVEIKMMMMMMMINTVFNLNS